MKCFTSLRRFCWLQVNFSQATAYPAVRQVGAIVFQKAVVGQLPQVARCCPSPRSPVRPLSNALRAFDTQWPWAPCESGLNSRHGWIALGEAAVDDVLPLINERQVVPSPAPPLPSTANNKARPAGATFRLGAQEFTVGAPRPVDRPLSRMAAGLRTRNLPSTWESA